MTTLSADGGSAPSAKDVVRLQSCSEEGGRVSATCRSMNRISLRTRRRSLLQRGRVSWRQENGSTRALGGREGSSTRGTHRSIGGCTASWLRRWTPTQRWRVRTCTCLFERRPLLKAIRGGGEWDLDGNSGLLQTVGESEGGRRRSGRGSELEREKAEASRVHDTRSRPKLATTRRPRELDQTLADPQRA